MPKNIVCPACRNRGQASIDGSSGFEVRGQHSGKPVRKCLNCGAGLYLRMLGAPRLIEPDTWRRMEAVWEREFGRK